MGIFIDVNINKDKYYNNMKIYMIKMKLFLNNQHLIF
jgi:hypothetical protein